MTTTEDQIKELYEEIMNYKKANPGWMGNGAQTEFVIAQTKLLTALQEKENTRLKERQSNSDSNNNDTHFHISPNLMATAQKKSVSLRQFVVQIIAHKQELDLIDGSERVRKYFESICECGTIVSKKFIATHAHGLFEFLEIGREFDVIILNCPEQVKCKVVKVSNENDCTILTPVDHDFTFSDVQTTGAYPAQLVISLGRSAVFQTNCFDSVDVSYISTSITDHRGHYKMSRATAPGDSGGGVFDFLSGRLVGMIASENLGPHFGQYAARGSMVPIFIISMLCGEDLFLKP